MNTINQIARGLLRLGAGLLAVAVIAVPVAVVAVVAGNPFNGELVNSLGDRQIGNQQIIKLLSIAFYALWAWFAIPALRQVGISLASPASSTRRTRVASPPVRRPAGRPAAPMPADEPGPRSWLARLVRFALSAATVATTMTSMSTGFVAAAPAAPTTVAVDDLTNPHDTTALATPTVDPSEQVSHVTAQRRDTPYSIARQHFPDAIDHARDEIVALNTGRPTPHGTAWSGGTFPIGMNVITPHFETDASTDPADATASTPTTYRVRQGDGWINVVEGLWGDGAGARWQELRLQLVGQQVAPGVIVTADTTVIHPDWTFTRPDAIAAPAPTPEPSAIQVVDRGDTLHDLIDDVVDEPVTELHIEAVAQRNDGVATPDGGFVFSASNPNLIHPGQAIDLSPAINLDTNAGDTNAVPAEPITDATPERIDEPINVPTAESVDLPADEAAAAHVAELDPPIAGGEQPIDSPAPNGDVDIAVQSESPAAPAPVITTPAPPIPIPTNVAPAVASQPGDTAATPPPANSDSPGTQAGSTTSPAPYALLAGGGLGLAGLFIALDRRRRKARAKRPLGTTIAAPDPTVAHNEHVMRDAAHVDRATRVNLAVRHLGRQLADRDAPLRANYLLADTDTVTVVFDRHVELHDGWTDGPHLHSWVSTIPDDKLTAFADDPTPWPALLPIGTLEDGTDVLIDIEGRGSLAVTGPDEIVDRFLSAVVTAISSSPYADLLTFVDDHSIALNGLDRHLQHRLAVDSVATLISRLSHWITPFDFDDQHLIAARREMGSEYEPCIAALITHLNDEQRDLIRSLPLDGSHPIAVLTTDVDIAATVLELDLDGITVLDGHRVRCHRLEPSTAALAATLFDVVDTPEIIDTAPLDQYNRLTHSAPNATSAQTSEEQIEPTSPDPIDAPAIPVAKATLPPTPGQLFDTEPDLDWTFRILGPLEIVHRDGTHLSGPKVRELATLLAMHPGGVPANELKRMLDKNETSGLSTRISELRKLLGQGDTVAGRTYLPANRSARGYYLQGARVDSVRLARCLDHARTSDGQDKINWLVGALELVRGQIGTGEFTSFPWAGHLMTTLEATIVEAGVELASLAAEHGSWTIVDWAANQVRLANPYEQRVFPLQIEARRALGDEVGIRRLHDEALNDVDEFEPDVQAAFHTALARQAR